MTHQVRVEYDYDYGWIVNTYEDGEWEMDLIGLDEFDHSTKGMHDPFLYDLGYGHTDEARLDALESARQQAKELHTRVKHFHRWPLKTPGSKSTSAPL